MEAQGEFPFETPDENNQVHPIPREDDTKEIPISDDVSAVE